MNTNHSLNQPKNSDYRESYLELIEGTQESLGRLEKFFRYKQINYATIEVFWASASNHENYTLFIHPITCSNSEDIRWWSNRKLPYNYSITGALFFSWKEGTILDMKSSDLCIDIKDSNSSQDSLLNLVCESLKVNPQKCLTSVPEWTTEDNRKYVDIEANQIFKGQLKAGSTLMLFPLIIDKFWYVGYIALGISDYLKFQNIYSIADIHQFISDTIVAQLISKPLRQERKSIALEIARKMVQQGKDTKVILTEALKQYIPFPVGDSNYYNDYLDGMRKFPLRDLEPFSDFQQDIWIPEIYYEEGKQKSLLREVSSLFEEISRDMKGIKSLVDLEKSRTLQDQLDRERVIAHLQKHLYRAIALSLDACDLNNKQSRSFNTNILNARLLSTYISLTNEMRQQGAYQTNGNPYAKEPRSINLKLFIEKLHLLVCILFGTNYGIINTFDEKYLSELAAYVTNYVTATLNWEETPILFFEKNQEIKHQELVNKISSIEFKPSLNFLNINLPYKRAFLFPLLSSFFEIFSNAISHARQEKVIVNFDRHFNRLIISTKDEYLEKLLPPSSFYENKSDVDSSKFTLVMLEKQFRLFSCSYEVSQSEDDKHIFSNIITDPEGKLFSICSRG